MALDTCMLLHCNFTSFDALDISLRYLNGCGVAPSRSLALENFRLSAEQGNIDGLYNLGSIYLKGGDRMSYYGNEQSFQLFFVMWDMGN